MNDRDTRRLQRAETLLNFKRNAGTARSIEARSGEIGFAAPFSKVPRRIEKDIRTHADSLLPRLEDNNAPVDQGGDTPEQKPPKPPSAPASCSWPSAPLS